MYHLSDFIGCSECGVPKGAPCSENELACSSRIYDFADNAPYEERVLVWESCFSSFDKDVQEECLRYSRANLPLSEEETIRWFLERKENEN